MDFEKRVRITEFLKSADQDDIVDLIIAAAKLQRAMYSNNKADEKLYLFKLRKALEGSFGGHDMPDYFKD